VALAAVGFSGRFDRQVLVKSDVNPGVRRTGELAKRFQLLQTQQCGMCLIATFRHVICDEDVEVPFSQGQQLPILLAAESRVSNALTFMTAIGKQEFDLPGDTLIEEQFHFKVAVKLVLASSIAVIASALDTLGKSSRNSDSVRPCSR
jgi:hypothetical protein